MSAETTQDGASVGWGHVCPLEGKGVLPKPFPGFHEDTFLLPVAVSSKRAFVPSAFWGGDRSQGFCLAFLVLQSWARDLF